MDIPVAAAAPWIAFGVVLGVVLLLLTGLGAALLLRRPSADGPPAGEPAAAPGSPDDGADDDLAGFLEHPPGSPGARGPRGDGWVPLTAPAPAGTPAMPAPSRRGPAAGRVLAAMTAAALLLGGAATAVALTLPSEPGIARHAERRPAGDPPLDAGGIEAHLSFGGVVLERRAVGVTATYPQLRLTGDRAGRRAQVELPTWNCLADEAPADPVAAGCRRSLPEYGDLATPRLEVTGGADEVRISGRFPTVTRPNGTPPVPTGSTYELSITVRPGDGPRDGWLPATGILRLGTDSTETTGTDPAAGINVVRFGDR